MQGLRVLIAAGEGVCAVESAGSGAVPSGAEIVLRQMRIVKLTGVQQLCRGISSIECVRLAVRIVRITFGNITRSIGKLPRRAVAVVEKVLRGRSPRPVAWASTSRPLTYTVLPAPVVCLKTCA